MGFVGRATGTLAVTILVALSGCAYKRPPPEHPKPKVSAFDEYLQPGVVVVALRKDVGSEDPFFRIQMRIVSAMVESGPVVIAVADTQARNRIADACTDFPMVCKGIRTGAVRVLQVKHDGPWIRDYGPQLVARADGRMVVLDANYNDVRQQASVLQQRTEVDTERLHLLKRREKSDAATRSKIDDRLRVLAQLKDVLSDPHIKARDEDDAAPYSVAQATLRNPNFVVQATGITMDGGNLMRLGAGVCATTTDVIPANAKGVNVDAVLRKLYRCSQIVYLRPLPGPVIKHVDMFLLPVTAHEVLLASYDPRDPTLVRQWRDSDEGVRTLAMEAALAMDADARLLTSKGFKVVRVPSPLPRSDVRFGVYYPTILNALVRVDGGGKQHVLVPTYKGYEDGVQQVGLHIIRSTFGDATVATAEATGAGKRQGAVHCLALVLPYDATVFSDAHDVSEWKTWLTMQDKVRSQREQTERRLRGDWRMVGANAKVFEFGPRGILYVFQLFGGYAGKYAVRGGGEHMDLLDSETETVTTVGLEWNGVNDLTLRRPDGGAWHLHKVGHAEPESPR